MPLEDFAREHTKVLLEADGIYNHKSQQRGQMWLEYPPSDKLREVRERIGRLDYLHARREELMPEKPGPELSHVEFELAAIEDALDAINYLVFYIKQIRRGMRG